MHATNHQQMYRELIWNNAKILSKQSRNLCLKSSPFFLWCVVVVSGFRSRGRTPYWWPVWPVRIAFCPIRAWLFNICWGANPRTTYSTRLAVIEHHSHKKKHLALLLARELPCTKKRRRRAMTSVCLAKIMVLSSISVTWLFNNTVTLCSSRGKKNKFHFGDH